MTEQSLPRTERRAGGSRVSGEPKFADPGQTDFPWSTAVTLFTAAGVRRLPHVTGVGQRLIRTCGGEHLFTGDKPGQYSDSVCVLGFNINFRKVYYGFTTINANVSFAQNPLNALSPCRRLVRSNGIGKRNILTILISRPIRLKRFPVRLQVQQTRRQLQQA